MYHYIFLIKCLIVVCRESVSPYSYSDSPLTPGTNKRQTFNFYFLRVQTERYIAFPRRYGRGDTTEHCGNEVRLRRALLQPNEWHRQGFYREAAREGSEVSSRRGECGEEERGFSWGIAVTALCLFPYSERMTAEECLLHPWIKVRVCTM